MKKRSLFRSGALQCAGRHLGEPGHEREARIQAGQAQHEPALRPALLERHVDLDRCAEHAGIELLRNLLIGDRNRDNADTGEHGASSIAVCVRET
jgi:hypothetical protein